MLHDSECIPCLLDQARDQGQWYAGQADAAAWCFDVLTLDPDHVEAATLVYTLFCDPWLIYDNRNTIQQQIEEWDDRPWQQRRRQSLSFRMMSRWEGWYKEYEEGSDHEHDGLLDVAALLATGRDQLLQAYTLHDDACRTLAWSTFSAAMDQTDDQRNTILWIAKCYADLGFFADAVEVLAPLCDLFDDRWAARLLAETRWWRDNAQRIPWLPPAGDGSRYRRMMAKVAPSARLEYESSSAGTTLPVASPFMWNVTARNGPAVVRSDVTLREHASGYANPLVDWSFLDRDYAPSSTLPVWVQTMIRGLPHAMAVTVAHQYRWSRPIPSPATPPHYRPDPWLDATADMV